MPSRGAARCDDWLRRHGGQRLAGEASHLKMGFDGCGVVAGLPGALFAFGLAPQCDAVVARLEALASSSEACRQRLSVNVLGLSRGGIAALQLAKKLESASTALRDRLRLAAFGPHGGALLLRLEPRAGRPRHDLVMVLDHVLRLVRLQRTCP